MGFIEMTEQEKELLAAVYLNEKGIREGDLFGYQIESLRLLRVGEAYLQEKYPECELSFLSFEPANKFYPRAVLRFRCGDLGEYQVIIIPQDGEDVCTDTLYAAFLQPAYDRMIEGLLAQDGSTPRSYTSFPNAMGKALGADADVEKLMSAAPKLPRYTHLFVVGGEDRSIADSLRQRLHDAGLYGSYTLYFIGDETCSDVLELEAKRNGFARLTFNCFDVA